MIIAFGHQKQQGKDTVCNFIQKHCSEEPGDIVVKSLAEKLYEICYDLHPEFHSKKHYDMYPEQKEQPFSTGLTPRQTLISLGQTMKSLFGRDCWVKALLTEEYTVRDLLISDLRFKEEADYLKRSMGNQVVFVKVIRTQIHNPDEADIDLCNWDGWNYVLMNSGNLEKLKTDSIGLYEQIKLDHKEG